MTYKIETRMEDGLAIENLTPVLSEGELSLRKDEIQQALYDIFKKYISG